MEKTKCLLCDELVTMKFVAIINGKKTGEDRITTFLYDDPGPLPPIVDPERPEEAKDGGVSGAEEHTQKKEAPKKPS